MTNEINERAQCLLRALVTSYIRDGRPVGSRKLAKESGLDLSPATIRNILADFEELGLVISPHTSAGRIPTVKGYRFFVDSLLTVQALDDSEIKRMEDQFDSEHTVDDMVESVSSLLSSVTSMAGLVMLPRKTNHRLRHIEFLQLSTDRVLAILVVNDTEVQNTIIHTERPYSPSELQQAANYLNSILIGKDLSQVRNLLLAELRETKDHMDRVMQMAINMAEKVFDTAPEGDNYVISGQTRLMDYDDLSNINKLKELFEAFNEKRQILHLLDHCLDAQGVQIFIGEESGYEALEKCSLVSTSYCVDGKAIGVLGVIGPTRMNYERVIPLVDVTGKLLSAALNQSHLSI